MTLEKAVRKAAGLIDKANPHNMKIVFIIANRSEAKLFDKPIQYDAEIQLGPEYIVRADYENEGWEVLATVDTCSSKTTGQQIARLRKILNIK